MNMHLVFLFVPLAGRQATAAVRTPSLKNRLITFIQEANACTVDAHAVAKNRGLMTESFRERDL